MQSMKTNKEKKDRIPNPLRRFDTTQSRHIPASHIRVHKRSVYIPKKHSPLLFQIDRMMPEIGNICFNDVMVEALQLWIRANMSKYLQKLQDRLNDEHSGLRDWYAKTKSPSVLKDKEEVHRCIREIEDELESRLSEQEYDIVMPKLFDLLADHCPKDMIDRLVERGYWGRRVSGNED